jgi:hypothetical protein
MNNAVKIVDKMTDHLAEGFKRIDPKLISAKPPKIRWGEKFRGWSLSKQNAWLMKFGEAMNHAADQVQKERDQLNELCEKKEAQINQLHEMMRQNNEMLQQEVTKFNEQRQGFNKTIARLDAKIRELESGD